MSSHTGGSKPLTMGITLPESSKGVLIKPYSVATAAERSNRRDAEQRGASRDGMLSGWYQERDPEQDAHPADRGVEVLLELGSPIVAHAGANEGTHWAVATTEGKIAVVDVTSTASEWTVAQGPCSGVAALALLPAADRVLVGGVDGTQS